MLIPIKKLRAFATLAASALIAANAWSQAPAAAPSSLDKMKQLKVATTDLNIPLVAQTGPTADRIKANLKTINVPPGFKIELYAMVPDARHMAVAPSTNMLFVGTRKTTVWAVTNRDGGPAATEVKAFAQIGRAHV